MRAFLALSLFVCLLAPYGATYTWLQYRKSVVRENVKQNIARGIEQDRLVKFRFTHDESKTLLEWEHELEFEYQGRMYDIVRTEFGKDSVTYWCWPDSDETELNRRLELLVEREMNCDDGNRVVQRNLENFSQSQYDVPAVAWNPQMESQGISDEDVKQPASPNLIPATPPPKKSA